MNLSASEVSLADPSVAGWSPAQIKANGFCVAALIRSGDPVNDPFRQSYYFFNQGRATAFAATLNPSGNSICICVYQSDSLIQATGDTSLIGAWSTKVGNPSAGMDLGEAAEIQSKLQVIPTQPATVVANQDPGDNVATFVGAGDE